MKKVSNIFILLVILTTTLFSETVTPKLDIGGTVRAKVEYLLESDSTSFVVRNARFKMEGIVNENFGYKVEVDLSDNGQIKMLDAYVKWSAMENLSFFMGQMKVPFSIDHYRSPHELAFSNRSFLSKYVSNEMRDIGFAVDYKFDIGIPMQIQSGIFNGEGTNKYIRSDHKYYLGRLRFQPLDVLEVTGAYAFGQLNKNDNKMFNTGLHYKKNNLNIEAEYVKRFTDSTISYDIDSYFIFAQYHIPVENLPIKYITPGIRYEDYIVTKPTPYSDFNISRWTAGLTFSFGKLNSSSIRINYEDYNYNRIVDKKEDKFTIEFMSKF